MLKLINHFSTALRNYVSPSDTEIEIPTQVAKKLNTLSEGDHTYISLIGRNGRAEIVKYTHIKELKGGVISVERDAGQTGALNHPAGTCVTIDLNTVLLDEYIADTVAAKVDEKLEAFKTEVNAELTKMTKAINALKKADK